MDELSISSEEAADARQDLLVLRSFQSISSPLIFFFFLHTCVILLFIADTEDGFDATVRFADAVAAAHVPVELEGRLRAAASAKTARVPQTELGTQTEKTQ